jgi:hypothetical protein
LLMLISFGVTLVPYIKDIQNQMIFGLNFETYKISRIVKSSEIVWINDFLAKDKQTELLQFYREDTAIDPEWYAILKSWVPKKALQSTVKPNTYMFHCGEMEAFRKNIIENKITKVVLVKSLPGSYSFIDQDCYKAIQSQSWLRLVNEATLKNKTVSIFSVL